jgi:hypothetical protein
VRLLREAVFIALPLKVSTMLLRANLVHVEPNWSGSLSCVKGISVCFALSVETVLWCSGVSFAVLINGCTRLLHFDAGHECSKQTNEFATHEQLCVAATRDQ